MAVIGRCRQPECGVSFDDAEHIEDALAKLQAHFRTAHPTKALFPDSAREQLQSLNLTLDEAIAQYVGRDWRDKLARGELQTRNITHACSNVCRYIKNFNDEVVRGAMALSAEHGVIIADPWAAPVNDPNDIDMGYDPGPIFNN